MKLVVGLGNIGKNYAKTRHNIGFIMLDNYLLAEKLQTNSYGAFLKKPNVIFLKPSTFMNLSGNAVLHFTNYYKIDYNDILVIYDDINIETGKFKIKKKVLQEVTTGIKSIISSLNTDDFLRLKIGISKDNIVNNSDFVLGKMTIKERKSLKAMESTIFSIIDEFIDDKSTEYLMNKYN